MHFTKGQLVQSVATFQYYLVLGEQTVFPDYKVGTISHNLVLQPLDAENLGNSTPFCVNIKKFMRAGFLSKNFLTKKDNDHVYGNFWDMNELEFERMMDLRFERNPDELMEYLAQYGVY